MSIRLKMNVLIVRKITIQSIYQGGLEQFRRDWMRAGHNQTNPGEDEHLIGFSSMGHSYNTLIEKLCSCGLNRLDIAVGDELEGIEESCEWLEVFHEGIGMTICWLKGTSPGEAIAPILI